MTHTYDWSKLGAGWSVDGEYLVHGARIHINNAAAFAGGTEGEFAWFAYAAKAQLAKCRITAPEPYVTSGGLHDTCPNCGADLKNKGLHGCIKKPDMATVTELRPRDEYDWSRLEGSGWYVEGDTITNYEFVYMFTRNDHRLRCDGGCFDAESALVAQQEAERLVAKCKRDWRDEVRQACKDMVGPVGWSLPSDNRIGCITTTAFDLEVNASRQLSLHAKNSPHAIEGLLRMSIIIERLKKLGWRES